MTAWSNKNAIAWLIMAAVVAVISSVLTAVIMRPEPEPESEFDIEAFLAMPDSPVSLEPEGESLAEREYRALIIQSQMEETQALAEQARWDAEDARRDARDALMEVELERSRRRAREPILWP